MMCRMVLVWIFPPSTLFRNWVILGMGFEGVGQLLTIELGA